MMVKILKGKHGDFIETNATIKIKGKKFTSGGSYILKNKKTKKLEGILYAYPNDKAVGTWDGKTKIPASYGKEYSGNLGDVRQTIKFSKNGKNFTGTYYKSGSDIVRVKETGTNLKKKLKGMS